MKLHPDKLTPEYPASALRVLGSCLDLSHTRELSVENADIDAHILTSIMKRGVEKRQASMEYLNNIVLVTAVASFSGCH